MTPTISNLADRLSKGIVTFKFIKKDGTIRKAKGTTNKKYLFKHTNWRPKGGVSSPKVLCFYDVVKGAWRSMSVKSKLLRIY